MKSLRLNKDLYRRCRNPFCRRKFIVMRKDHRFCRDQCKRVFFAVKYGLQALVPYFDLADTGRRK
jgi:hypothetical protein